MNNEVFQRQLVQYRNPRSLLFKLHILGDRMTDLKPKTIRSYEVMIESTRRLLLGANFSEKYHKLNTKVFSKKVMFNTMLLVMRYISTLF